MFQFDNAEFRYEPYPVGLVKPVMEADLYRELVASFPPIELFAPLPGIGNKFILSARNNADNFRDFIARSPTWQRFHDWIESEDFIRAVDAMLRDHFVDLELSKMSLSTFYKWRRVLGSLKRGRFPNVPPGLKGRFEFSMLPVDGGYVRPHTDMPQKVVTLVIPIFEDGEWDLAFGGGTDINRAIDPRHAYNQLNEKLSFDDTEVLHTYPFGANQCLIFVKTFNSLHSVRPMTGAGSQAMRRSLTVNIELRA
jgi:hypothetical protein